LLDVKSETIKKIYGSKYKFVFLNSGWIVLQSITHDKNNKVSWSTQIKTVDLESSLQYLWTTNRKQGDPLVWEDLPEG